tara:strand:- start:7695 stop:8042 length:348 start_codon:yes stop_codon:yes gene_type:complete
MLAPRLKRQGDNGIEIAVIYSPGFGAGWSTWNQEYAEILLFHKELALYVDSESDKFEGELKSICDRLCGPDSDVYVGGSRNLSLKWVPEGTEFVIQEYDGSEQIRVKDSYEWMRA